MKNFNDSIKRLLAFVPQFEQFQRKINDYNINNDKEIAEIKKREAQFDSSRRTFGDQIAVLKSHIDKEFKRVESEKQAQDTLNKKVVLVDKKINKLINAVSKSNKSDGEILKLIEGLKLKNAELERLVKIQADELNNFKRAFEE